MAERKLEKVSVVESEDGHGFHLAVSWMTGGNGREAELLPTVYDTEDAAAAAARADYGVDPAPGDHAVDRRP
ncbi:MAG: hypothetical protein ABW173_00465 [Sphingomonas sp.]